MKAPTAHRTSYAVYAIVLLCLLAMITLVTVFFVAKDDTGEIIMQDIARLADIFERIDEQCEILSFDQQKNPINFLTVKKDGFVGSEVGSLNLAYPQHWDGPYVADNPSLQGIEYEVVRIRGGYFIAPGTGVKLPNGKVMGKDIVLGEDADIYELMQSELLFQGRPLVVPLTASLNPGEDDILAEELV